MCKKLSCKVLKNVNKQYEDSLEWGKGRWVHKTLIDERFIDGNWWDVYYVEVFDIKKGVEKDWEREYYNVFRNLGFYDNHFEGEYIDALCQGNDYISELEFDEHNDTEITLEIENEFFY